MASILDRIKNLLGVFFGKQDDTIVASDSDTNTAGSQMGWPMPAGASADEIKLRELLQYTYMMAAVIAGTPPPAPYTQIDAKSSEFTGFQAAVYQGPQGQIVGAFAGTDPGSAMDIATDVVGSAAVTPQDVQAVLLARRVVAKYPQAIVVFVGHSLGGRLAAEASIATGRPAVTLNAAGVSTAAHLFAGGLGPDAPGARQRVTSYEVAGDILSTGQEMTPLPVAFGMRVVLPNPGDRPLASHSIAAAQASIQELLAKGATPGAAV